MWKKIRKKLFPPELEEFKGDLARENAASLMVILYTGLVVSFVLFLMQYVIKADFATNVRSLEYLLFFCIAAGLFTVNRRETERKGTGYIYICTSVLLGWGLFLYIGDDRNYPSFMFIFMLLSLPLFIRGAFGFVLVQVLAFSALFVILDIRKRPLEVARLDLIHLCVAVVTALFLSYRLIKERITVLRISVTAETRAEHDALTGLYNRRGGEQLIRNYVMNSISGTFMMIDVDHFKHINDTYGHARGDETLRQIAQCLQKHFRGTDVVMRLGGDEFVVYAVGMADLHHVEDRLKKLTEEFRGIVLDPESGDHVTCSIGCMINLGSWPDYTRLSQAADRLLYVVKEEGRDGYRCSDADFSP